MLFLAPEAARDTMCDTGSPPRRPAGTLMTPNLTRTLCLPTVATTLLAVLLAGCNPAPDRSYAGYIEGEWMYLAAPLGGYLDTLPVARGSRVAASAPVFSVEAVPEQQGLREAEARADSARQKVRNLSEPRRPSEVAAIEAQLRAAQAALALSTRQLEQAEALAASKFVSDARVDEARAAKARDAAQVEAVRQELATTRITVGREPEVRAAQAEAEAAVAQVAQRQWQVDRKVVRAPLAGEITETYYRPGEWVAAGAPGGQPAARRAPARALLRARDSHRHAQAGADGRGPLRRLRPTDSRHDRLHRAAGRVHTAGHLQPGQPGEAGVPRRGRRRA
jgi:multidrug resistance efflux pump